MSASLRRTFPPEAPRQPAASPAPVAIGRTADFLDLQFEVADQSGLVSVLAARAPDAPFAYVVTPNVDHIVRLAHFRSDLWPAYRHAWMRLCDSRVVAGIAAIGGLALPACPGSDLTVAMLDRATASDDRILIVGGEAVSIDALCRARGLTNVVQYIPPMGFINDPAEVARAVDFIVAAQARYTFFAVGSPQQELLAYLVERRGGAVGIGLCIGASMDFLTGRQHRAPLFMQRLGLEWMFRLMSQPGRMWRRYLVDGPLIFGIYRRCRRHEA